MLFYLWKPHSLMRESHSPINRNKSEVKTTSVSMIKQHCFLIKGFAICENPCFSNQEIWEPAI